MNLEGLNITENVIPALTVQTQRTGLPAHTEFHPFRTLQQEVFVWEHSYSYALSEGKCVLSCELWTVQSHNYKTL